MNGMTDNRDNGMGRAEFIGYMKRAIEDMGKVNNDIERRLDKVEKKVNGIEIKLATAMGGVIIIWYLIKDIISKHLRIF